MSYNKQHIESTDIKKFADELEHLKLIDAEQKAKVFTIFNADLYTPNLFIRIGLFVFTIVLVLSGTGLIGLTISALLSEQFALGFAMILCGGGLIFILNFFIRVKKHWKSGIDDCLLYLALIFIISGIGILTDFNSMNVIFLVSIVLFSLVVWKYADSLIAGLAFITFVCLILLNTYENPNLLLFVPFIIALISGITLYLFDRKIKSATHIYYLKSFKVLKFLSLLTLYISLNYFVVKEGYALSRSINGGTEVSPTEAAIQNQIDENFLSINETYADTTQESAALRDRLTAENDKLYMQLGMENQKRMELEDQRSIPFGVLFMFLTAIIPLAYILAGLYKKDRIILISGLFILFLSALTFQKYNPAIQPEWLLTLGGILLLVVSFGATRYLRSNNKVFDVKEPSTKVDFLQAEGIVLGSTFSTTGSPMQDDNQFGGGQFGGGGAGSSF
ncbi:MAG: hypothetical protein IPI23_15000 [Bacteroidetes bacterium]|nr:hypothetical protein [Bacteroidota bacterium]